MSPAVEGLGVRKAFARRAVLHGVDLSVAEGTVHALLGPNGAGKTTLVRILATLLPADAGTARVCGHDVSRQAGRVRRCIGLTGQFSAVDDLLTGRENLRIVAALHHLDRAERLRRTSDVVEALGLGGDLAKPVATLSGGTRRKLDLALTLIGRPQVLFLDEPTTGLDPRSRREMWRVVRELVAGGTTVLLTTQYLDEADALADRVSLLHDGRIVAEGTPADLKRRVPGSTVRVTLADTPAAVAAAAALPGAERNDAALSVSIPTGGDVGALRRVLTALDDSGARVVQVEVSAAALDDVFLALTGPGAPAGATTTTPSTTPSTGR